MIEIAAVLSVVVAHWADFAIIMTLLLVNAGDVPITAIATDNTWLDPKPVH
ncbi:hypothetical protein [Acidithiobacillus ferriphilus]|uniref:hypothetical protein n=1 Tax=Acidithiobacillus ferriphilus TaxID=1689834 RepID=UPI0024326658|nr:hypothetical protein [Acidithiobacillus ferriphilus]